MTDRLPSSDYQGRISQLGSGNLEEINAVYNLESSSLTLETGQWQFTMVQLREVIGLLGPISVM